MAFSAPHGVYPEERKKPNRFEVDVEIRADLFRASTEDTLDATIDYARVQQIVSSVMLAGHVNLIETLTHRIGEGLQREFDTLELLIVRVRKFNPPMQGECKFAEVEMQWPG